DGSVDPKAYMRSILRDGLIPALREDLAVMRAFMRVFNMLDSPMDILNQADLLPRILSVWQRRGERDPIRLGPRRGELVEEIRSAAA
ncbi:MAG: hypothetical protein VCC04_04820, partial [Myxococcota bacterium]